MTAHGTRRFPPSHLEQLSDATMGWLRPVWFLALMLAIALDIASTVFVLRDVYRNDPQFNRLSLNSQVESDGSVSVTSIGGVTGTSSVAPGSYITAIDGEPVSRDTRVWDLASRLEAKDGQSVTLAIAAPDGTVATHQFQASDRYRIEPSGAAPIGRDVRMALRMTLSLLACITLLACSVLLFLRRPRDPVALLFSFAFVMFAASIDPPMQLWMASGLGHWYDAWTALGWGFLVIGLAVFPDGRFEPRAVGWLLLVAPLAMIPISIESVPLPVSTVIAFVLPLFLLICHVIKYRRFPPGIERQQVKWAAFGFASGLVLLTAAFVVLMATETPSGTPVTYSVIIVALFNLGFIAMALGLLISILRFRLWEADAVISRSAISAAVTLMVGIVWTLSMDMLKVGVAWLFGEENATVATIAGGLIAAGIFAPTQALAMRWTKRRLEGDESRIKRLADRLTVWRSTESPEEICVRTLSALQAAIHCSTAAVLVDGPRGPELLASRDVERAEELSAPGYEPADDSRFTMRLRLEDEDGPIGLLLVGPRSDLNRYNAAQLRGLGDLTEPLAEALRAAQKRERHAATMQLKLGSVEERLARLEQSGPRLSPT
jgi:hypothetical protein